ncbi:uncharacterized protein C6C3.02c-like [Rhododendron vialii]|uniref:uncharacterized protein C6C3.02c-like n=1 Tax=Rhododendron vialii TaxID=182163 RepID=UPI00265EF377|nr:uncharacterized protein C6C3.02c-like [Rhododendron vialii]
MARSRRSSGGMSWSAPRPAARAPLRNPPQPAARAPPPAPLQRAPATGGLGSVVAEGMAFGGGNAIAHRAVDAMMGPRTIRHETVDSSVPSAAPVLANSNVCDGQSKAFADCLSYFGSDISKCQFYMDMLSECRKNPTTSGLTA